MTIIDRSGRVVNNIRVSVTQKCNFHCFYCHKEGDRDCLPVEMAPSEIARIVGIAAPLGVSKVKITGGEPLLREDIIEIVRLTKRVPGIKEVSMTTNGSLLQTLARDLKKAGLDRVNISLDTMNNQTFRKITGSDSLEAVLRGVEAASSSGLTPVKINMVLLRGVNDDQVWPMVDFSKRTGLILQLIEYEASHEDEMYLRYHTDLPPIEERLRQMSDQVVTRSMHHRQRFILSGGGEVEVVKPMHNTEFCKYCNRIRVTSDGKFKPCLMTRESIDFLTPLRNGASDDELRSLLMEAVWRREPFFK